MKGLCMAVWMALMMAIPGMAWGQMQPNRLVETSRGMFGDSELDWENQTITVTAVGTYDPAMVVGPGDKILQARANADLRARAKIVEMNYGVLVTANVNLSQGDAELFSAGILRDSRVLDREERTFEDGTVMYITRMQAPMLKAGDLLSSESAWRQLKQSVEDRMKQLQEGRPVSAFTPPPGLSETEKKVFEAVVQDVETLKPKPEPRPDGARYTGLVVDARHLPDKRVTWMPRIVDERDRRVYGIEDRAPSAAMNMELVQYTNTPEQARRLAGSNPLEIRALRADPYNPGRLVVSTADGSAIVGANELSKFLEQGQVILVF